MPQYSNVCRLMIYSLYWFDIVNKVYTYVHIQYYMSTICTQIGLKMSLTRIYSNYIFGIQYLIPNVILAKYFLQLEYLRWIQRMDSHFSEYLIKWKRRTLFKYCKKLFIYRRIAQCMPTIDLYIYRTLRFIYMYIFIYIHELLRCTFLSESKYFCCS